MSDAAAGRLWVLWRPAGEKPAADQPVLSFLSPPEEESLEKSCRLIRAREVVQDVREAARSRYLRLVANIGLARLSDGRTLRQALARPGEASRWWFHPVSFKDPDGSGDRAYDWLLTVETVRAAAARSGALELFLWGAPAEVEAVLAQGFSVRSRAGARPPSAWATVVGARRAPRCDAGHRQGRDLRLLGLERAADRKGRPVRSLFQGPAGRAEPAWRHLRLALVA
ncbi:MAG: hypothetical protein NTX64_08800 [Elusimicrobia bacterium]|nr:hypothetical protein [Elusimicrobiota bacterium]